MPFDFSFFEQDDLQSLAVCLSVEDADQNLAAQVFTNDKGSILKFGTFAGARHAIRLGADRPPVDSERDHIHVHLNFFRGYAEKDDSVEDGELTDILAVIDQITGKSSHGWIGGRFHFKNEMLPKDGWVSAMSGLSADAGGESISLVGAEFNFGDSSRFLELGWKQERESIAVSLDQLLPDDFVFSPHLLDEQITELRDNIAKLVFGRSPGASNDE
ncbi:hypothetical protein ACFL2H_08590 [Planctomycetota bacterium]